MGIAHAAHSKQRMGDHLEAITSGFHITRGVGCSSSPITVSADPKLVICKLRSTRTLRGSFLSTLSRLAHRIHGGAGKKPRPSLPLLPGMSVDGPENALREGNVDSCGLVAKLARIHIDNGPGPTPIAALLLQLIDR